MRGGSVLVVEDDQDTRETLAMLLRLALEVRVDTARDGAEARQRLEHGGYDLVLTDERMPRMTGSDLLRWARTHRPDMHRALMTAYQDGPELARAAGAEVFLKKPLQLDTLLEDLGALLPGR